MQFKTNGSRIYELWQTVSHLCAHFCLPFLATAYIYMQVSWHSGFVALQNVHAIGQIDTVTAVLIISTNPH